MEKQPKEENTENFKARVATSVVMLWLLIAVLAMVGGVAGYSGKVLLVSMDGFRWDYIHKVSGLGNFTRLAETGCRVDHVNNAFTTVSFPLHYTMVTGKRQTLLSALHHGHG